MGTSNLFISYRRDGGGGYSGRLFDATTELLGRSRVFMDATGIEPGENFVHRLRNALQQCKAMAVIVTPGWSEIADAQGPRLHRESDWVRIEIETALSMGVRVVPTLVAGARMPAAGSLPASLRAFAECQAVDLRDASWDDDVRRLVKALGLQPRSMRRVVGISALAAFAVLLMISALATWPWNHSRPNVGDISEQGLATLTPTDTQQAAIVQRTFAPNFNAVVLQHFLAGARERAVPANRLSAELDLFTARYGKLQLANFYDDTGVIDLGPGPYPSPKCDETLHLMREGDFRQAIAAFDAGAKSALGHAPINPARRIYAAWCTWLRGQTELLEDAPARASTAFDDAINQSTLAGKDGERLRYRVLRDSAHLDQSTGQTALAVERLGQAAEAAGPVNTNAQTDLLLELAALQDSLGQPAAALKTRERAQTVFDAAHDPGDKKAQDNAHRLIRDYDASNRLPEAQALRKRYGLATAQ